MKLIDENAAHPELAAQDMHGPVEVDVRVYFKQENGVIGRMTFTHPTGQLPTRTDLAQYMEAANVEAAKSGASLPTKPEFVAHVTRRETGKAIPMAGARHWVQASSEIPREVLMHALTGIGSQWKREQVRESYVSRGLALDDGYGLVWNAEKLAAMTDCELEAMYREVANG